MGKRMNEGEWLCMVEGAGEWGNGGVYTQMR